MSLTGKLFSSTLKSQLNEQVLVILDLKNIQNSFLDVIYSIFENYELNVSIVFGTKVYTILSLYELLKDFAAMDKNKTTASILKTLNFVEENFVFAENQRIDFIYDVLVITDYEINADDISLEYTHLLADITAGLETKKNSKATFRCILFDVLISENLLSVYSDIYSANKCYSIAKGNSAATSLAALKNTLRVLLNHISFPHTGITRDVEMSFIQDPDLKISCDIHSLSKTNLNVAGYSMKTKMFDREDLEQKEIVTSKVATDIKTTQVVPEDEIKMCFEIYDGKLAVQEKVAAIFTPQIILGKNEDVYENPFISVLGFVPSLSLEKTVPFGHLGKAVELVASDAKYENSVKFLTNLASILLEKGLAIVSLAKLRWNENVRNYAIFPKKLSIYDENLIKKESVKLFIVDIPFKDEIRMYPRININSDYKISQRENEQYNDLKNSFKNIYCKGSLNLGNGNLSDPKSKLDEIIASCGVDLQTKRYQLVMKDAILKAENMNHELSDDEELLKQDVEILDPTLHFVKHSTRILLQNHADDMRVFSDIKDSYKRQSDYIQQKHAKKEASKRSLSEENNENQEVSVEASAAPKKQKLGINSP